MRNTGWSWPHMFMLVTSPSRFLGMVNSQTGKPRHSCRGPGLQLQKRKCSTTCKASSASGCTWPQHHSSVFCNIRRQPSLLRRLRLETLLCQHLHSFSLQSPPSSSTPLHTSLGLSHLCTRLYRVQPTMPTSPPVGVPRPLGSPRLTSARFVGRIFSW